MAIEKLQSSVATFQDTFSFLFTQDLLTDFCQLRVLGGELYFYSESVERWEKSEVCLTVIYFFFNETIFCVCKLEISFSSRYDLMKCKEGNITSYSTIVSIM